MNFQKIIILFVVLAFFVISNNIEAGSREVDKAVGFVKAGMFPQAMAILEKEINDNPTNAEAHYQLGICYANQNRVSRADERFSSAVGLNPDRYALKVGKEYRNIGMANLAKNNIRSAKQSFQKAVEYLPRDRVEIGNDIFSFGEKRLQTGQLQEAEQIFQLATAVDPFKGEQVSDLFFNIGESAGENDCLVFYKLSAKYSSMHNERMGQRFLEISKTKTEDKEIEEWRDKASLFTKVQPNYKIYGPGEYKFRLKAGEKTNFWIQVPDGVMYSLDSADDKFQIIYFDGETISAWLPGNLPNKKKFKLFAVKDQLAIVFKVRTP